MDNKVVFVTGIAGFIGFHTAKKMVEEGYKVIGIDNINDYYQVELKYGRLKALGIDFDPDSTAVRYNNAEDNIVFYKGDIQDYELLVQIVTNENFKGIIHLAAQAGVRYSLENPNAYIDSNIKGFLNIIELARHYPMEHVVYASSSSVYGTEASQPFSENEPCNSPVSLYAATKKANESMAYVYAGLYDINLTGLRFFTVYGPWGRPDMAPMIFTKAAFEDKPIKVFNYGKQSRDFTYIDDITEGIFRLFERGINRGNHKVYNIGNGAPVNLLEFIETIEEFSEKPIKKELVEAQPGDVVETFADISQLSEVTNFKPQTNLRTGIKQFIEWYKNYYTN